MEADAPEGFADIKGARILAKLGDSVTTDHISPAGAIKKATPGGKYLMENGVEQKDFNSYGARRGNHEVMVRGTFANIRLNNQLAPGTEGGYTRRSEDGEDEFIFDASMDYQADDVPLGVLAGRSTARAARVTGPPRARSCWASASPSPRATSASTAPTWWAWASCRCSSPTASRSSRWA